ncbi:MAG TPA: dTDP-4-dehydrorhamnose 3,5-epimerase family protein [Gemmataceae bacterium]|nr:dTDP-4-dehydrorhamnose 3,5-epimerase family protein [Gemmataceae bacterium]
MQFEQGPVEGVIWRPLRKFHDSRGWLCELYRDDELPEGFNPTMCYVSESFGGVQRGPHEHVDQTDYFCFLGPSNFEMVVWDNRPGSPTFRRRFSDIVGVDKPMLVVIPPGVVHAYRNVGTGLGWVFNLPNRMYKGAGRKEEVDEIRHEADPNTPYQF